MKQFHLFGNEISNYIRFNNYTDFSGKYFSSDFYTYAFREKSVFRQNVANIYESSYLSDVNKLAESCHKTLQSTEFHGT